MIVTCIEVSHFRAIKFCKLECAPRTALIGRNGVGKSSFLHALAIFFDPSAPVTAEDFFYRDLSEPIEIRVTFSSLSEAEINEFQPYLSNGSLIVKKRIRLESGRPDHKYFAASPQVPDFVTIRQITNKRERVSAWRGLVASATLPGLGEMEGVRSADEVEQRMASFEATHPELRQMIEREEQFFGPRNIGGGKLDKYTKFVLVPAVREASDELGKKGSIQQLIDIIVLRKVNEREDIRKLRTEFERRIKEVYNSANLGELPELGESISELLTVFAPGSRLNLTWEEVEPPEITLPQTKATLIEDEFEGEISRKGHGLQRALIVTLLQHLARAKSSAPTELGDEVGAPIDQPGPDLILAVEEPELYQHPARCRHLAKIFSEVTKPGNSGKRSQIIYATHSPHFIDLQQFPDARILRKYHCPDGRIACNVSSLSLENAVSKLEYISGALPGSYTVGGFFARSAPIMTFAVNEGFFAEVVVIVEGMSEVGVLWKLQEILDQKWIERSIVVIPAGGKENLDRPTVIFQGFSIPVYLVFDADCRHAGKKGGERTKFKNHRYLRLVGAPVEDFPETRVNEHWAVLADDLEGEIKGFLGEQIFDEIRTGIAVELGYDRHSDVLKNVEASAQFIAEVYKRGLKIPILEDIVRSVSKMAV